MIISDPRINEANRTLLRLTLPYGGLVDLRNLASAEMELLNHMTKGLGMTEFDIENESHRSIFVKMGWIHFGVANDYRENAFATVRKGHQFIVFNLGVFFYLRDVFLSILSLSEFLPKFGDSSSETSTLEEFRSNFIEKRKGPPYFQLVPKCAKRRMLADYLTAIAIKFIYAHEVAHLVYCHIGYNEADSTVSRLDDFVVDEKVGLRKAKRCFELEADREAAHVSLRYLYLTFNKYWKIHVGDAYSPYYIWVQTIEVLFKALNPHGKFEENTDSTHPNHFIRILNLLTASTDNAVKYKLVDGENKFSEHLESSIDLHKKILNPINFLPNPNAVLADNIEAMNDLNGMCDRIFEEQLKWLSLQRFENHRQLIQKYKNE